ncbi:hypothetical protein E0Z10_g11026 [Xylaria hypoxylon]|uniref:HRPKS sdrA-like NAD(P)-binding domain-containing protein n=1 Tax=Xylaria hypoxylon TaxID=37992 RepID=A0A4Z0XV29_9PEZI|nr:hypothetical protein E0Z10_g11026 [Xylaria hypoxylon]
MSASETASEFGSSMSPYNSESPPKSASSLATTLNFKQLPRDALSQCLITGLGEKATVFKVPGIQPTYLCGSQTGVEVAAQNEEILVARFADTTPLLSPSIRLTLEESGYRVIEKLLNDLDLESATSNLLVSTAAVLVMDELVSPVLANISENNWDRLKVLISLGKPVLWVTTGAQTGHVNEPENSMVQGLFRVVRREDPGVRLFTLDVQSPASLDSHWAIKRVLRTVLLNGGLIPDNEYAERDGMLMVPRVVVDKGLNTFKDADLGVGLEPVIK